jgi:hypothetical protein
LLRHRSQKERQVSRCASDPQAVNFLSSQLVQDSQIWMPLRLPGSDFSPPNSVQVLKRDLTPGAQIPIRENRGGRTAETPMASHIDRNSLTANQMRGKSGCSDYRDDSDGTISADSGVCADRADDRNHADWPVRSSN